MPRFTPTYEKNLNNEKIYLLLSIFVITTLACSLTPATPAPTGLPSDAVLPPTSATPAAIPPTTTPEIFIARTQAVPATESAGTAITFAPLSLVLPMAVASGASGSEQPRLDSDDAAWWMKTPGHLQVSLADYYVLQRKSHQPLIAVFPAVDYATLVPAAFEAIHRLDNIFYDPSTASSLENLPAVPFFNDKPVFASNIQMINFQNGKGVRFITQTAQGPVPVNNQELFYHFEGLTSDGFYYIVAILPLTAPALAETNDAAAPPGRIAYPGSIEDFPAYYAAVTALLDATAPDAFTPNLAQLDALIQSMRVAP
jgi:hypothetical protein